MSDIEWIKVEKLSLALSAQQASFDLHQFHDYPKPMQAEIKKRIILEAHRDLKWWFEEEIDLSTYDRCVYVIKLSNPFAVEYETGQSNVLYIGRGYAFSRIKKHYNKTLFDLFTSLSGTHFDFWICKPRKRNSEDYYKKIEWSLLDEFKSTKGEYPLLNKIAGTYTKSSLGDNWDAPIKNLGYYPKWILYPTKHSEFAKLS